MKIIAYEKLTLAYLRTLSRYMYFATTAAILIVVISILWMLFHIGGNHGNTLFADAVYSLAALMSALWAFQTVYWASRGPIRFKQKHRLAWLLIGFGMVANCLGGAYYFYLEYTGLSAFPSYADIFFNLFYPLVFLALFLIPTTQHFRLRMGLDAFISTSSLFGISWFFLIGPLYIAQRNHISYFEIAVALSYPIWDIILLFPIALLVFRRVESTLQSSLILFTVGILCNIWADSLYAYLNVFGNYQSGTPYIDPFWSAGFLLMGLAALYQYTALVNRAYQKQAPHLQEALHKKEALSKQALYRKKTWRNLQSVITYVPLLSLLTCIMYEEVFQQGEIVRYLVVFAVITGTSLIIRYLLATYENERLLQERAQKQRDAEHLRHLNTQLTDILEIEHLREKIVALTLSELHYDAVMLLLAETFGQSLSTQPVLSVQVAVATTHTSSSSRSWKFQGDNGLYQLVQRNKATEVLWNTRARDLPPEIYQWQLEAQLPSMHFFPLTYHEKMLGSIGVVQRTASLLDSASFSFMKAYAEQVAVALEHAYLYEERKEHERFSRAMANLATRLNAAVVEPTEIQRFICTEAAEALHADYALLYSVEGEQLVPIATCIDDQVQFSSYGEWPPIKPYEYEAQALYSLQPTLLHIQAPTPQSGNLPLLLPPTSPPAHGGTNPRIPITIREQRSQRQMPLREKLGRMAVHTAILAPLIASGEPIGMLVLARSFASGARSKKSFEPIDLQHVQDFMEQAAVAFTNAQLYQHLKVAHQRQKELDQLKDQFMITASHELRTPLTAVQGYLELLSQYHEILPEEEQREFLQKASRSCDELVVMLANVMDASRLEVEAGNRSVHMESVSLREMVESVINLIGPHLKQEQREVHVSIPAHIKAIADPIRFRQVLTNISVNALKYSQPGTPLAYSVHSFVNGNPWAIISISDKGNGIKPEDQAHIFERFFRLERDVNSPVRGSGLGLYISRRLIEAMNGKIWIESSGIPGEGSTFHIQLPLSS